MAKPIKETPVLKGKDARTFLIEMKKTQNKKVNIEVKDRIMSNFNELNSIAKFLCWKMFK